MNKIERERLEKTIDFLKILNPRKFDFGDVISKWDREKKCGSVCCVIGWVPAIFPRLVKWSGSLETSSQFKIKGKRGPQSYGEVGSFLFGIDSFTADTLFNPSALHRVHASLRNKGNVETPKQVAKMLEKFLKLVDKGEITP